MRIKYFFIVPFLLFVTAAHSQSFLEINSENEQDLKAVIKASREDNSRKKTFFAFIKLGSFYLNNNKIPECDSVLTVVEHEFNDLIIQGVRWNSMDVSDYYQLLSSIYFLKSDNLRSKLFLEKAQQINPDVFSYSNNLYRLFVREGKLDSAELYLQRSFPAISKSLDIHKLDAQLLNNFHLAFQNMCHLKIKQGDVDGFEYYLSKWLQIPRSKINNPHGIRKSRLKKLKPWQLLYLSKYSIIIKKFDDAERLSNFTNESSKEYKLEYLRTKAQIAYAKDQPDSAVKFMKQALDFHKENVKLFFPFLTEAERENYITQINDDYDFFLSVIADNPAGSKPYLTDLFQFQLFRKGLLLDITKKLNKITSTLDDQGARMIRREISDINDSIASVTFKKGLLTSGGEKEYVLNQLNSRKQGLEKKLLRMVQKEAAGLFTDHSLSEITEALPADACLAEMIRFNNIVRDPKRILKTAGISYLSLIISHTSNPELSLQRNGDLLEGRYSKLYKNSMTLQEPDRLLYDSYWKDVAAIVRPYKQVFISPDGIYNVINLNTLQNHETGQFVLDETQLIYLTNSKDLLEDFDRKKVNNAALLLGYPQFSYAENDKGKASTVRGEILQSLESITMQEFAPLPGTLTEIRQIDQLIRKHNGNTTVLEGKAATEASLKSQNIPEILHLATHGFFISSENNFVNPLLKSGLVLAGVNNKGNIETESEDGVLTAFEIASLNLQNTNLVVLSACETGLGEIKNGDGVYGLQRAFKIAEANYIIISMWKVDDAATMKLMTNFYTMLMNTSDVVQSFSIAQKELRKDFPYPYYWGAFKLIGY
jgi:CHAT domain-containing protein